MDRTNRSANIDRDEELEDLPPIKTVSAEEGEEDEDPEARDSLQEWIDLNRVDNSITTVTLYKYSSTQNFSKEKERCGYWADGLVPSWHEIGLTYGSGKYLMIVHIKISGKQPKTNTQRFRIHAHYDTLKKRREEEERKALYLPLQGPVQPQQGLATVNSGLGADEMMKAALNMVQTVVGMIRPLIQVPQQIPQMPVDPFGQNKLMGQMMQEMAKNNLKFFNEMQMKALQSPRQEMEETEMEDMTPVKEKSMLETLMPILSEVLVPLLKQPAPIQQATIAGLRAVPTVANTIKQVTANAADKKDFVKWLDGKTGNVKKSDVLLKQIGVKR